MIKKKLLIFLSFVIFFNYQPVKSSIDIVTIIEDDIVTSYDIFKESQYLIILNPQLTNLDKNKINELAKESLIIEKIKKLEIKKNINFDNAIINVEENLKTFYQNLNFDKLDLFEAELKKKEAYSLDEVRHKIKVDLLWNELIYKKYINQVKIDELKLKNKIQTIKDKKQKEYFLYEIVFNKKNQNLEEFINQISLSIQEIGFNNTANIYSISETAKLGGKIGWIKESNLPNLLSKKLSNLKEGEYTNIIKIKNDYLIIKIDKIREIEANINEDEELKKLIRYETNNQLEQFSKIYFNKVEKNYQINEK